MPFLFATQILTVAIVLRTIIFLFNDFFLSASIILKYFLLGGLFYINFSNIILPSSMYFFAGTYLIVVIYFLLAFKLTKQKLALRDVPILLMLMFIYPYFITLIYSQSYFKEMLGVKGKWLRVSI